MHYHCIENETMTSVNRAMTAGNRAVTEKPNIKQGRPIAYNNITINAGCMLFSYFVYKTVYKRINLEVRKKVINC